MTFEALNGDNKEGQVANLKSNITYRKLMQTLGTEWREATGVPTLWGEIMLAKLGALPKGVSVIVDDFRFPLEGNFLKAHLDPEEWIVKTVRVTREKAEAVTGHSSEGGLKDWVFDHVIDNNGTVTALYEKVKTILV
jgi:CBS domain containing-hemolysin-like protein